MPQVRVMSDHLRSAMSLQSQRHPGPTSWIFNPIPSPYLRRPQLQRYTSTPNDTSALSDLDVDTSSIYYHCTVTGLWTTLYLVHQIIACILYATHLDLNHNWRQRQDEFHLASALYHDDVVTKVGFDKR